MKRITLLLLLFGVRVQAQGDCTSDPAQNTKSVWAYAYEAAIRMHISCRNLKRIALALHSSVPLKQDAGSFTIGGGGPGNQFSIEPVGVNRGLIVADLSGRPDMGTSTLPLTLIINVNPSQTDQDFIEIKVTDGTNAVVSAKFPRVQPDSNATGAATRIPPINATFPASCDPMVTDVGAILLQVPPNVSEAKFGVRLGEMRDLMSNTVAAPGNDVKFYVLKNLASSQGTTLEANSAAMTFCEGKYLQVPETGLLEYRWRAGTESGTVTARLSLYAVAPAATTVPRLLVATVTPLPNTADSDPFDLGQSVGIGAVAGNGAPNNIFLLGGNGTGGNVVLECQQVLIPQGSAGNRSAAEVPQCPAPVKRNVIVASLSRTRFPVTFEILPQTSGSRNATSTWLTVAANQPGTPTTLTVTADPAGLGPGTYTQTVRVTATGATNSTVSFTVTLKIDPPGPYIRKGGAGSAATYVPDIVSPGLAVTIFGDGFGPDKLALGQLAGGALANTAGDTQVLVDDIPSPMIYSVNGQVSAFVPFALDGKKTTQVQVVYKGVKSPPRTLTVVPASPGLLSADSSGGGPGAILNQDFSLNSAANPALAGSVVLFFAVGAGQTSPAGRDGRVVTETTAPVPKGAVSMTIGGKPARLLYAADAPQLVEGVLQVNAVIPDGLPPGPNKVVLKVGEFSSPDWVTVAVK